MYWLDSSEFAAAAFELGVAHPPGHPLQSLVGKLFALLPIGPVALRVGLASATASAAAAAIVCLAGAEVARRTRAALRGDEAGETPIADALVGGAAGLGFGLSHAALQQAVRPEVYALNAALLAGAAALLLRHDRAPRPARSLFAAALVLGCALANHHFLAALFCVAAILFLAARGGLRPPPVRTALIVIIAGLAGLALYAYLPARAAQHPLVDWGAPTTPGRFLWTVSARAFQKSLGHAAEGCAGFTGAAVALAAECGLLAPLALVSSYLLLRLRATRAIGVLLVAGALLVGVAPALVGFDPANPDAYGYLEPAVAFLCIAASAAPAAALALAPPRARVPVAVAVALLLAAAVAAPAREAPMVSLARFRDTERFAAVLLDGAPPRAMVATSYFQTVFALFYDLAVEGRRPDLDHVHRHFLAYPGYRDDVLLRRPALAPLLGERDLDVPAVLAAASAPGGRPIVLEYDLDLPDALALRLRPGPLLDAIDASPDDARDTDARGRAFTAAEGGRAALHARLDPREPQTRRFLLWLDFLDAELACRQGRPAEAMGAVTRARALVAPAHDPDLEALAEKCRLPPAP